MRNEFAKWEIKTSVFSGRISQAGNCWVFGFRLDPCHNLVEFIGQLGTGSH